MTLCMTRLDMQHTGPDKAELVYRSPLLMVHAAHTQDSRKRIAVFDCLDAMLLVAVQSKTCDIGQKLL